MNQLDILLNRLGRSSYNSQVSSSWKTKIEDDKLVSVNLSRLNLDQLNSEVFDGLHHLESLVLSHNLLESINAEVFKPLTQLKFLWLHNNHLDKISDDTFIHLTKLQWLYLNNNHITSVSSNSFRGLSNLQDLRINRNPINEIKKGTLDSCPHLVIFAAHSCELNQLPTDLFENKNYLERVYLQENKFDHLPDEVLQLPDECKVWIKNDKLNYEGSDGMTIEQINAEVK